MWLIWFNISIHIFVVNPAISQKKFGKKVRFAETDIFFPPLIWMLSSDYYGNMKLSIYRNFEDILCFKWSYIFLFTLFYFIEAFPKREEFVLVFDANGLGLEELNNYYRTLYESLFNSIYNVCMEKLFNQAFLMRWKYMVFLWQMAHQNAAKCT